jgi:LysM repeat protein
VAGLAAAFCLSPQAAFASPAGTDTGTSPVFTDAAVTVGSAHAGPRLAELLSADWQARAAAPVAAAPVAVRKSSQQTWYTVRSGDSLSAIAAHVYHDSAAWPVLYWANKSQLQSADLIQPGQRLRVPPKPAKIPSPPVVAAVAAPVASAPASAVASASAPQAAAPAQAPTTVQTSGNSSFQQCVIARESGGNSQVMNSSGHYGLYQFSASTWAAYGGNPADFGNASVGEQNQVFANAMAAGGQSNWSPYDGC